MTNQSGPPLLIDRRLARNHRRRALARGMPDFLNETLGAEIADRLAGILREFPVMIVHRSHPGSLLAKLAEARPATRLIAADSVAHPGTDLVLDEESLPFASESLDALIWILGLEQLNDVPGTLIQIRRALRPDGLFLGAALAGDSLIELRQSLIAAESEMSGGASPRVVPFADIRDWGMLMQTGGICAPGRRCRPTDHPLSRRDRPHARPQDTRSRQCLARTQKDAHPPRSLARAAAYYAERFADPDGRIRATFEIAYLTGWAPHESQQKPLKPGSARQRLADALRTEEIPLKSID